MKEFAYPAVIKYDRGDRAYTVEFPDLPGCVTFGETIDEAKVMAQEAISGYLASIFDRGFKIPVPSKMKGKETYPISPESAVLVPILLRKIREEEHLNQTEAAKRLKISYQSYQKFENPKKANPRIKTIEKVFRSFGRDVTFSVSPAGSYAKTLPGVAYKKAYRKAASKKK